MLSNSAYKKILRGKDRVVSSYLKYRTWLMINKRKLLKTEEPRQEGQRKWRKGNKKKWFWRKPRWKYEVFKRPLCKKIGLKVTIHSLLEESHFSGGYCACVVLVLGCSQPWEDSNLTWSGFWDKHLRWAPCTARSMHHTDFATTAKPLLAKRILSKRHLSDSLF